MAIVNTNGTKYYSKHRNNKKKGKYSALDLRDTSGKPIKGSIDAHYRQVYKQVEERFTNKKEALNKLPIEELAKQYEENVSKSSTDRAALQQVYTDKLFKIYDSMSEEDLTQVLNEFEVDREVTIQKKVVNRVIELKQLKNKITKEKEYGNTEEGTGETEDINKASSTTDLPEESAP